MMLDMAANNMRKDAMVLESKEEDKEDSGSLQMLIDVSARLANWTTP